MKSFATVGGLGLSIVTVVLFVTCTGNGPQRNLAAGSSTGSPMPGTSAGLASSETSGKLPLRTLRDLESAKPTMALFFHAGDVLFKFGIVILICVAVVVVFSTLARRADKKRKTRHRARQQRLSTTQALRAKRIRRRDAVN